jgi:hypothetical protein
LDRRFVALYGLHLAGRGHIGGGWVGTLRHVTGGETERKRSGQAN